VGATVSGPEGAITSTRNTRVLAVAALHRAAQRRTEGVHVAEGVKVVAEALVAAEVVELFHLPTFDLDDLPQVARVRATSVDERVMARMADAVTPQGVLAVVRTPDLARPVPPDGPVLVLDGLGDPGNVGTLIRTAAAFGVTVVVTDGSADPFGPKAVRASAGACYRTPVLRRSSVTDHRTELQGSGRRLLGLSADADLTLDQAIAGAGACVLVLGGEPRGLAHATRDALDATVRIPMAVGVESLNVAAAGAIALHAFAGGVR
jgi:TrmH family RNA methyltransferase